MSNAEVNEKYSHEYYAAIIAERDEEILKLRTTIGFARNRLGEIEPITDEVYALGKTLFNAEMRAVERLTKRIEADKEWK